MCHRATCTRPLNLVVQPLERHRKDRERAALEWTEAVTLITDGHVPEPRFDEVRSHFSETELSDLTLAVATINAWNRLSISARLVPGAYQPARRPEVMKEA